MKTALIMMTILGCDDSVSQCEFVETPSERFVSIELCDAASEEILGRYTNIAYPTAVAVCQTPPPEIAAAIAASTQPAPDTSEQQQVEEQHNRTLKDMAVDAVRQVLPGKAQIKMIFEKPIHVVSDSYSWVAKKIVP
ncbi:hypothetical protein GVN24_02980 [Rhizobium sp. CRIBSB]|uniref:Lipoprotein n=1 Tax=Peteryoungia aggregata LMG 23059 TaxID=1368425 RepID=A0ABU0G8X6_9HYPH|nr:hypothetical protein [Peteryoungia aggregata]MDQ0421191.1 hypothetical protein [Peteryoungia aggregata LMG 23059]NBB47233.1 hypothetical protein [Rhizobium sp. CRIBSB]